MRFLRFFGDRLVDCRIDGVFRILHRMSFYGDRKIIIDDMSVASNRVFCFCSGGHNFFFAFFVV